MTLITLQTMYRFYSQTCLAERAGAVLAAADVRIPRSRGTEAEMGGAVLYRYLPLFYENRICHMLMWHILLQVE